jgi:hypothetical protein
MLVFRTVNDNDQYDQVNDIFFVHRNQDNQDIKVYKQEEVIKKDKDIHEISDMLVECLRMISPENTCSMLKINSNDQEIESSQSYLCRGQIEMIKRLVCSNEDITQSEDIK